VRLLRTSTDGVVKQLPLRLRRGQLHDRLAVGCPHPSGASPWPLPTHSCPGARALPSRQVRRVGVLRSVRARMGGHGVSGTGSAALALRKHPSHRTPLIPTLRPPHLPHPAHHTRRVQPAALLRLTLHVSVRCRLHPRRMASSRTPTRGSSFARCPSYQAQAHAPAFVYPFARRTAYTPPLLATSGHPVARDQLDQAGQDRRDQLLLLASRPVVLPHTRLGSGSHMHSIFIRQVQALLYLLLALY
jgi:hypothetical protein